MVIRTFAKRIMVGEIDEALELLEVSGPEYGGGFSNHGLMAAAPHVALAFVTSSVPQSLREWRAEGLQRDQGRPACCFRTHELIVLDVEKFCTVRREIESGDVAIHQTPEAGTIAADDIDPEVFESRIGRGRGSCYHMWRWYGRGRARGRWRCRGGVWLGTTLDRERRPRCSNKYKNNGDFYQHQVRANLTLDSSTMLSHRRQS